MLTDPVRFKNIQKKSMRCSSFSYCNLFTLKICNGTNILGNYHCICPLRTVKHHYILSTVHCGTFAHLYGQYIRSTINKVDIPIQESVTSSNKIILDNDIGTNAILLSQDRLVIGTKTTINPHDGSEPRIRVNSDVDGRFSSEDVAETRSRG